MEAEDKPRTVIIEPPKFEMAAIKIVGTAPYVQNKFTHKAQQKIKETQEAGQQARKNRKREPKNFTAAYHGAMHVSREGWCGIPAPAFRNAMISACRTVGFKMTIAKMSVFIEADGFDAEEGTPLVRIYGEPHPHQAMVRNASGVTDMRLRPMWNEWSATVRVRWDADQFSASDVVNLLARAGGQVGVGEGRPDSKGSNGQGWGIFEVIA